MSDSGAGTSAELPLGSQAWDGPPWYGPWYNSPLQRPPSQFEWGELLQISEELLTTRSRIEYDIQQLRDQIEEQHGRYDAV